MAVADRKAEVRHAIIIGVTIDPRQTVIAFGHHQQASRRSGTGCRQSEALITRHASMGVQSRQIDHITRCKVEDDVPIRSGSAGKDKTVLAPATSKIILRKTGDDRVVAFGADNILSTAE